MFNLRAIQLDGSGDRQLTFGDQSYVEPDVHTSGKVVAGRITSRSDIWKIPVGGTPAENTRGAVRVTRQTGQVQVPSVSPDDREVVYVSDTGGHTNLWIARTDGSGTRPITFETSRSIGVGIPVWSPRGDQIAFVRSRRRPGGDVGHSSRWQGAAAGRAWMGAGLVGRRPLALLLAARASNLARSSEIPIDGGAAETVREGAGINVPALSPDGHAVPDADGPFQRSRDLGDRICGVRPHRPGDGPDEMLARVAD